MRPDQTETVKEQNGKTLVTAGTIKRLSPCPEGGIENRAYFRKKKEKTEQKERKKDKKENRKEKKGKLRKMGVSSIRHAPIDHFLSPPSNLTFF